jgi:hypothetical protein
MRALKSANPDSALLPTLKFIYTAGKTRTKSDYARAYATEIAMAACEGLITTLIGDAYVSNCVVCSEAQSLEDHTHKHKEI